jgi:hypothetical protein
LGEDPNFNYQKLIDKSDEILETVKSNYLYYLRRSVESYFDKRIKISEFLQKYSEEIGITISGLTTELISDLYKTIGIIIGAIIAAFVAKEQTYKVIHWTSFLYLIYIGFILIYLLPSILVRFCGKIRDYYDNTSQLKSLMLSEEIDRFESSIIIRWKSRFWIFFIFTYLCYILLGVLAIIIYTNSGLITLGSAFNMSNSFLN